MKTANGAEPKKPVGSALSLSLSLPFSCLSPCLRLTLGLLDLSFRTSCVALLSLPHPLYLAGSLQGGVDQRGLTIARCNLHVDIMFTFFSVSLLHSHKYLYLITVLYQQP